MATYYWVGGTGTWDAATTTNWATSTGGAGGAGVPTSADAVVFDSASGTGTCTTGSGATCLTVSYNTATVQLTLGANLTAASGFTLTAGTISLGTYTLSCSQFLTNVSTTRTIDFGTGNITLTGNGATIWSSSTVTGLTILGTPVVNCTYSGATGNRVITPGSGISEAYAISFNVTAGTDTFQITNGNAVKNLNFTGYSGALVSTNVTIYGNYTLSSTMTTADGNQTKTFAATSGTQVITTNGVVFSGLIHFNGVGGTVQLADNLTALSTRTVTLTNGTLDLNNNTLSTGIFSSSNSNTRSIAFGTGNITLTGSGTTIWGMATATNFSYTGTPTVNCTYSGSTGARIVSNGGTAGISESNVVSFNITAATDTFAFSVNSSYKNIDFTGFTGTLTNAVRTVYGDFTFGSGMTLTAGSSATTFASTSGTKTITTNNVTVDFPLTFNGVGGTWSFADALTQGSTRAFTITNGTVKLKAGATSTVGSFVTSGTNQKYLQSTTAGSQATLSQASGTVTVSYLSIKDIAATGGATWNAYVDYNNVDQGDNTGWDFSYSPAIDNEFPIALRSFTQPKRF